MILFLTRPWACVMEQSKENAKEYKIFEIKQPTVIILK